MGFYIISKIAKMSVIETLELLFSFQGLLNIFIIAMLWWIFYVITNRTKAAIILTTLSAFCFAFANYMMLLFRDSPLIATDIINWRTGMERSEEHTSELQSPSNLVFRLLLEKKNFEPCACWFVSPCGSCLLEVITCIL